MRMCIIIIIIFFSVFLSSTYAFEIQWTDTLDQQSGAQQILETSDQGYLHVALTNNQQGPRITVSKLNEEREESWEYEFIAPDGFYRFDKIVENRRRNYLIFCFNNQRNSYYFHEISAEGDSVSL